MLDRFEEAVHELELAAELDKDGSLHYQLGTYYRKLGREDKVAAAFAKSQELRERAENAANRSTGIRPGRRREIKKGAHTLKITGIDCHVLLDPGYDVGSTSSAQDDMVVEVHTDDGISGVGETDVNPWIARACIEAPGTHTMGRGLTEMLLGENPLDIERLWEKLYIGSAMNGRRGAVINALGALDMALHDFVAKPSVSPVSNSWVADPQSDPALRFVATGCLQYRCLSRFHGLMGAGGTKTGIHRGQTRSDSFRSLRSQRTAGIQRSDDGGDCCCA